MDGQGPEDPGNIGLPDDAEVLHIVLKKPITIGNAKWEEFTFVEPTAGQLRQAANGAESNMANMIKLAHIVAKVPERVIEAMPAREFAKITFFLSDFMNADRGIGRG